MQGDAILTGQIDGRKLGQALFQFMPTLPHESPIPMPRALARQLFPGGFVPRLPAQVPPAPVTLIPPAAAPPVVPAPAVDANGNQIQRRQPMPAAPPAPRKRVLERGTFPSWH